MKEYIILIKGKERDDGDARVVKFNLHSSIAYRLIRAAKRETAHKIVAATFDRFSEVVDFCVWAKDGKEWAVAVKPEITGNFAA